MFIRTSSFFFVFFLFAATLTGCSSSGSATSKFQKTFNFSQITSYSFYDRNSDFSDFQNIDDTTRNSIELAIEQVLDKNGFEYQLPENANVIVAYHLISQNAKELASYNKGVKYCYYCLRGGEEQKENNYWKIMPGSLIIDIVDPEKQRSIWRSIYDLKIEADRDNSKVVQHKIYQAIDVMMARIPIHQQSLENKITESN